MAYLVAKPKQAAAAAAAAAVYQIPNTEHMAYRLVRTLVYKRGVGIRETVWVGVWFGKSKSVAGVGLFLPAEPRRRSVPLHGVLDGGVGGRQRRSLGPSERDGQGGGGREACLENFSELPPTTHHHFKMVRLLH